MGSLSNAGAERRGNRTPTEGLSPCILPAKEYGSDARKAEQMLSEISHDPTVIKFKRSKFSLFINTSPDDNPNSASIPRGKAIIIHKELLKSHAQTRSILAHELGHSLYLYGHVALGDINFMPQDSRHEAEFFADKFSALISNDVTPLIDTFKKAAEYLRQDAQRQVEALIKSGHGFSPAAKYRQSIADDPCGTDGLSHPSYRARIDALEKIGEQLKQPGGRDALRAEVEAELLARHKKPSHIISTGSHLTKKPI